MVIIRTVFDSILSNLPSIEVISVLLDEVYEFNDSNLLSTPSTKCVEPVSNVILLLTLIVPPPLKPCPLPIVIVEWSMCSFATKPVVSS